MAATSHNLVIFIGNLTHDPEIGYDEVGKSFCRFRIGVNNRRNRGETLFVDLVAWDELGDHCNNSLRQGAGVLVQGQLRIRSGETHVVIDSMQQLPSKKEYEVRDDRPSRLAPAEYGSIKTRDEKPPVDVKNDAIDVDAINQLLFGDD